MDRMLREDHHKVIKLLRDGIKYPEVMSVIEGNNPGDIFVDNINTPTTGLVWNQGMEGFYFIGDSKNKEFLEKINGFINNKIKIFLKKKHIDYFEFSGTTVDWEKTIEDIFSNRDLKSWGQLIYIFNGEDIKKSINKFRYDIHSLKDSSTNHQGYSNWRYYKTVLTSFWGSIDNLIDKGNCYYATDNNKIIGVCYSGFSTSETNTIGIETDRKYQQQSVGYNLAMKCIKEMLGEGKLPWWDCMEENIPSKKLAEKLGFIKREEYICYKFSL